MYASYPTLLSVHKCISTRGGFALWSLIFVFYPLELPFFRIFALVLTNLWVKNENWKGNFTGGPGGGGWPYFYLQKKKSSLLCESGFRLVHSYRGFPASAKGGTLQMIPDSESWFPRLENGCWKGWGGGGGPNTRQLTMGVPGLVLFRPGRGFDVSTLEFWRSAPASPHFSPYYLPPVARCLTTIQRFFKTSIIRLVRHFVDFFFEKSYEHLISWWKKNDSPLVLWFMSY